MNRMAQPEMRLRDVRVPRSLLSSPDALGGRINGPYLSGDLIFRDGKVAGLERGTTSVARRLVIPKLVEPHVHLDKCHTVDRLPQLGGDLRAAIEAQSADKANWTEADLSERATRGVRELIASGCGVARSHVDWPSGPAALTPPISWHVMREIAEEFAPALELQLAPLVSLSDLEDPNIGAAIAEETARIGGALGSFVLDQPNRRAGITAAFKLADRYGLPLDFHVDEGLAEGLDGLSLIAEIAIETGFEGPILCGHACSLMNLDGSDLDRVLEQVRRAGISVAVLPTTNLYLQGRGATTPDRRGVTRVRELLAAGVPVVAGTDNVRDAFCPTGAHDPIASLSLAVLAAHLDPPLAEFLPMITTGAASALGRKPTFVDGAAPSDLLICEVGSTSELLTRSTPLRPVADILEDEIQ